MGEQITIRADGRDADGWFAGVRWSIDDPAIARFVGPAVGAAATIEVLAPGPIRVRAEWGGVEVKSLLAGVAAPPPGRAIDLSAYGIGEDGRFWGSPKGPVASRVITTEAGWHAFTSGVPAVGRTPEPKELKLAPPPVDFATSSLVVLFERLANANDDEPVLTRVVASPPGLVEVVHPKVNHLSGRAPALATFLRIFEVAKLPEGVEVRVIRE